jgi:two-component system KDP operon response regulator KdpE
LLIDDDPMMVKQLESAFTQEGFHVDDAAPGLDAIRTMLIHQPDLVVLGIDSQDKDWQFCHRLLTFLDRPLLLLLSTTNYLDRVRGLELGADDCMIKPVLTVEVIARARALLRRSDSHSPRSRRSFFVDQDLVVDLTRHEVWRNSQPIALTPTEFRFLSCFVEHLSEVLTHERLAMSVWGRDTVDSRHIIKLYVHQLRRKLEPDPSRPQRIMTRRGEGYIFRPLAEL